MRLLKIVSCFLVVLFLSSCQPDNLVYTVEGQVNASELQETIHLNANQKSFSFDLNESQDFKVYVKELSELSTLNFTITSDIDLTIGNSFLKIDNIKYQLKNLVISNNVLEISDPNILAAISNKLLENKNLDLVIENDLLNSEVSYDIEMKLNLKGVFLGVH